MADPEQAGLCARELADHLLTLTAKTDLQVVQGSKFVVIRHTGINKGNAALSWLGDREYDFVLGIGDDTTDEDFFKALPPSAFSIRVGITATHAQYNVRNNGEVIQLLRLFAGAHEPKLDQQK
jgi:trehalose 6-phosphate synthase/phosphatase